MSDPKDKDKKAQTKYNNNNCTGKQNKMYKTNVNSKYYKVVPAKFNALNSVSPYFTQYPKEKYQEYYFELVDFLRIALDDIKCSLKYSFKTSYYDTNTNSVEHLYDMLVYDDDSIGFDYLNQCTDFRLIRVKMKDVFKACRTRGDALKLMQFCMKCFSIAAE